MTTAPDGSSLVYDAASGRPEWKLGIWGTVLDVDFSAQPNQTLATDGAYSIGGTTFQKVNSANDATAAAIVNGQGLVLKPTSTSDYFAGTFSLPGLRWNLAQIPGFAFGLPVRVWCYFSAQNVSANFDAVVAGFETVNSGTPVLNAFLKRCFDSGQKWLSADNANGTNIAQVIDAQNLSDDVMLIEAVDGIPFDFVKTYSGTYSAGFPAPGSMLGHTILNPTPVNISADSAADPFQPLAAGGGSSGWNAFFGAQRSGSATALSVTIARVRVDVRF